MTERRRCAVLGSPIAHSLSPVLWRAAYAGLDLDWTYDAIECTADALPERLAAMAVSGEWAAVSLTMPLKLTAVGLVDELDAAAAAAGAVNTVVFGDDGVLRGLNTDVPGLTACLEESGAVVADRAAPVVLGGGGTARAAIVALGRAGAEVVRVLVRDPARATALLTVGARSGCEVRPEPWPESAARLGEPPVVVQCTPAGAADSLAATDWPAGVPLIEALYEPWPTPLGGAAQAAGARVVGGRRLLVHQARVALEATTGRLVPAKILSDSLDG
ncbi:MAG TPA: shikimate dehydrogenase [Mycobacteriales bacterium]|nr:shikimate dehydrogenase [Mycobacteriales bacterium]